MDAVVEFRQVSKWFTLRHEQPNSLAGFLRRLWRARRAKHANELFYALNGATFQIGRGRTVGLIGTNGSGKSTALKLMAGILQPNSGEIVLNGRLSALLELGAGMHPDLTGRENVTLNGSLMGLSNAEMQHLYPAIVDFAEIGRFMDMPVKHYSSGMFMRLGFSIATHVRPDILLIDEVLAVGDQNFQNKCLEHLHSLKRDGTTIVVVSHSGDALRDLCDELIWLKDGIVQAQGPSAQVMNEYLFDLHLAQKAKRHGGNYSAEIVESSQRWGSREVEITGVRMRNGAGEVTETFLTGETARFEIDYIAHQRIVDPMFGLALMSAENVHITGPNNKFAAVDFASIAGRGTVVYTIPNLPLLAGSYDLTVSAYETEGNHAYDFHYRAYPFHVSPGGTQEQYGLLTIPARWEQISSVDEGVAPTLIHA